MRGVFALGLVWATAETLGVASQAAGMFGSYDRLWLPVSVVQCLWLLAGGRALLFWPRRRARFEPMVAPWAGRPGNTVHQFFVLGFVAVLVLSVLALLQAFLAEESMAACGASASSCTSEEGVHGVAYNARGFFSSQTTRFADHRATLCLYSACAWPDSTGLGIIGYAPQQNATGFADLLSPPTGTVATHRREDYPDPAVGLSNGFFLGFGTQTSPVALCPGSYVDPDTSAVLGRGVCSYCAAYFRKHRALVDASTAYCTAPDAYAEDDSFWCEGLCPGLLEVSDPGSMMRQFLYVVVVASCPLRLWALVFAAASMNAG